MAWEINTSMLFNLDFANNIILSSLFLFFLIIDLSFLISAAITRIFNPIIKLSISIGISTKEAKAEIEKLQKESYQYYSKLYKPFYASYLLIPFNLFLQLINFVLHLFFFFNLNSWFMFLLAWLYIYWYSSLLLVKPRTFNITIDLLLCIFFIFMATLTVNKRKITVWTKERLLFFFLNIWYFSFSKKIFFIYYKHCNAF